MEWQVKKVLWMTSCLVVAALIVGVPGVQASFTCPVKIRDDGVCKVFDANGNRITASSSNTTPPLVRHFQIVETPSAPEDIGGPNQDPPAARENKNATCRGQLDRDPKGAAIVYNKDNTGCDCNIKDEDGDSNLTPKWSQTLGPEGQFKLDCHFTEGAVDD